MTTSRPTEDVSEAQAWTALLGLDGYDPFAYDGSLNGFPFLASSAPDAFPLTPSNFTMPAEPPEPHQTLHPVTDVNIQAAHADSGQRDPRSPTTDLRGNIPQPWPPPLPSIGPESSTVRISDAVISRLRGSLGEDDPQTPTPAALRLFLGTYFDVFNVHLPLMHAPSFDFEDKPQGMLLAMAAVGALYRLERRAVALLYRAADAAAPVGANPVRIGSFHQDSPGTSAGSNDPGKWHSLAYYQTRLLLQYVGILGGDSELADRSLCMIAELSFTVSGTEAPDDVKPDLPGLANTPKAISDLDTPAQGVGKRGQGRPHMGWLDRQGMHETVFDHQSRPQDGGE